MTTKGPSASGSRAPLRLSIDNGQADQTPRAITRRSQSKTTGRERSIICGADGIDYLHNPATMGPKEKTRSGIYPNAHQEYLRNESKPNAAS